MGKSFQLPPGRRYVLRPGDASTSIRSLAYDADTQVLEVEFPSGERYAYRPVPKAEFAALLAAESMGTYLNTRIKPRYAYEKLD